MAVASQLSRGEGFTTLWLEHHWQKPYALPRPDDFRYPGLTVFLALGFRLGGIGYDTALVTAAVLFLCFVLAFTYAVKKQFGAATALLCLPVTGLSLLQMHWNGRVYTEGLFALGLTWVLTAAYSAAREPGLKRRWFLLGLSLGLLYLIRPNGILMLAGAPWLAWPWVTAPGGEATSRSTAWQKMRALTQRLSWLGWGWLAMTGAWLWRTAHYFGNPFHIAGSAGLLRDHVGQSHQEAFGDFFQRHAFAYPGWRIANGWINLLKDWHTFEYGLEIIPWIGLVFGMGLWLWRRFGQASAFPRAIVEAGAEQEANRDSQHGALSPPVPSGYPGFFLIGLALNLTACAYAAFDSWAGLRYASAFIPWIYALGLFPLALGGESLARRIAWLRSPWRKTCLFLALGFLLLLPVVNPYRYFIRASQADGQADENRREARQAYLATLAKHLREPGIYYAKSMCQLNFMTRNRCVGLQELYDSSWFERSERAFRPGLLVIGTGEEADPDMQEAMARMRGEAFTLDTLEETALAVFLAIGRPAKTKSLPPD